MPKPAYENVPEAPIKKPEREERISYMPSREAQQLFFIDFRRLINQICHHLAGEEWDDEVNEYLQNGEEMINEDGRAKIRTILRSNINKAILYSDLTQSQINDIAFDIADALSDWLADKFQEYDVDPSDLSLVLNTVENNIFSFLRRAKAGGEREAISKIERRETVRKEKAEGGGVFEGMFG